MPPRAWVRPIPDHYADATTGGTAHSVGAIDVSRARRQHAAVVRGLRWLGYAVAELPVAHALPDSVFVEDPAVVAGRVALIANSAHPVRAREAASVRDALRAAGLAIQTMPQGAVLDGGDVLEVGDRLFVSPSARTNAAGIHALADAFPTHRVVEVALPEGVLHLKCACSTPAPDTVLLAEGSVDPAAFDGLRVLRIPAREGYAANTVGRAGRVLVAAGYPQTRRVLGAAGLDPRALALSEIARGDGSITCLSLRSER